MQRKYFGQKIMKGIILSHGAVFVTDGRITVRLLPSGACDVSPITYKTLEWDLRTEPQDSWDYLSETELRNLSDDGFAKISAVFERANSLLK